MKAESDLIKWEYYSNLFREDSKNPGKLKLCPKLTREHINPSKQMKMRVYLATQVSLVNQKHKTYILNIFSSIVFNKCLIFRFLAIRLQLVLNILRLKIHNCLESLRKQENLQFG